MAAAAAEPGRPANSGSTVRIAAAWISAAWGTHIRNRSAISNPAGALI
jgi:hypothetical protein